MACMEGVGLSVPLEQSWTSANGDEDGTGSGCAVARYFSNG